jgi:hypothetical protein
MAKHCAGFTRMISTSMPSSGVHDRLKRDHLVGGVMALVVQASFLLLVLLSPSHSTRPASLARETLLFFPPLAVPAPSTIDARGPRKKRIAPSETLVVRFASPPVAASPLTPPSGLAGFGQALFGCAPEHYADLTPDQRAHCPKPGEGLANQEQPDLMGAPSHVKDNARWANAMAHKQTLRMMPGGLLWPLVALGAVLDGSISEPHSAFRDPEQWPNERNPSQFMPHSLDEQEHIYDDWNRKHAVAAPDCVPGALVGANRPAGARLPCPASRSAPASAASSASSDPP